MESAAQNFLLPQEQMKNMINFLIFGALDMTEYIAIAESRFLKNFSNSPNDKFDIFMVMNLAKSFYHIGQELDVGSLKTVDLQKFTIITRQAQNDLLVVGIENLGKFQKVYPDLGNIMGIIHAHCTDFKRKHGEKWDPTQQGLKEQFLQWMRSWTELRRELKHFVPLD